MTARRIPNFHAKLTAALHSAGLPPEVDIHVDGKSFSPDPDVYLSRPYSPGSTSHAKARARTDATNREHLDPAVIVGLAQADAAASARDTRYTDDARRRAGEFADVLAGWLIEHGYRWTVTSKFGQILAWYRTEAEACEGAACSRYPGALASMAVREAVSA